MLCLRNDQLGCNEAHRALDQHGLAVPARREPATQGPVYTIGGLVDAAGVAQNAGCVILVAPPQAGLLTGAVGAACRLAITPLAVGA